VGLTVLIPEKAPYTLYARGEIESHAAVPGRGTFIKFSDGSAVVLFYKWKRHRRAYIVREAALLRYYAPAALAGLRGKAGIIGKFRGRRVDLLRRSYFNLERINGVSVYRFSTRFWQRLCCLIDGYGGCRGGPVKSGLLELSRRYALAGAGEGGEEHG
jgi:hypothetical protein